MGQALDEKQQVVLKKHFSDAYFVEALLRLVAQVRSLDESQQNTPLKSDFYAEAMTSICAKGGRMAMDRLTKEIQQLAEVAIDER